MKLHTEVVSLLMKDAIQPIFRSIISGNMYNYSDEEHNFVKLQRNRLPPVLFSKCWINYNNLGSMILTVSAILLEM